MDLEQMRQKVANMRLAVNSGKAAYDIVNDLVCQVEQRIDGENRLNLPIDQQQVDMIFATYTPLLLAALPAIDAAGNALRK